LIDRIAPTRRPDQRPQGYQQWRSLLFLHWSVPISELRKLVPDILELDLWEGTAYIGLVPFAMEDVRPAFWPAGLGMSFLETNVRTYVHHAGRPGVYFFSLEAASRIAVWAARRGWSLPYYHARMAMVRRDERVLYASQRGRSGPRLQLSYRIGESLGASEPGSLEHFLLERYLLFVERGERLQVGQVHHPPYPAHQAEAFEVHDELIAAAGLPAPNRPPDLCHYSPGVDVEVFSLRPVD
jgi:uncharacterized protein YqjF (DUF2071 family)